MSEKNIFEATVDAYLKDQPEIVRRKDTIMVVAALIINTAQWAAVLINDAPAWVGLIVMVLVGFAQALTSALTPGAVTPSMGKRLAAVNPEPRHALRETNMLDRIRDTLAR